MAITKDNLIAMTNKVIHDELEQSNVKLSKWELRLISVKVIEKITKELAKQLVSEFAKTDKFDDILAENRKVDNG